MDEQQMPFGVERAEESSGFLLWQVTTLWQRGIKKALEPIGLTHPQFVLLASLMWLQHLQAEVMQIDLSNHSKIDPMTTSTVLRTLEGKHLLERKPHPTDTRAKLLALTPAGRAATAEAVKIIERFDTDFFATLGGRLREFNGLMHQLALRRNGSVAE